MGSSRTDDDCLVIKRVVEILNALVRAAGRGIELSRTFHIERPVRTFVVELL
jgi:hypothetical protein